MIFSRRGAETLRLKKQNHHSIKNQIRIIIYTVFLICINVMITSCGLNSYEKNETENFLDNNIEWPYKTIGIFNIIEAGDYDEFDCPGWIVGFLEINNSQDEISIEFNGDIAQRAQLTIDELDSNDIFTVWINKPVFQYGIPTSSIVKIEKYNP